VDKQRAADACHLSLGLITIRNEWQRAVEKSSPPAPATVVLTETWLRLVSQCFGGAMPAPVYPDRQREVVDALVAAEARVAAMQAASPSVSCQAARARVVQTCQEVISGLRRAEQAISASSAPPPAGLAMTGADLAETCAGRGPAFQRLRSANGVVEIYMGSWLRGESARSKGRLDEAAAHRRRQVEAFSEIRAYAEQHAGRGARAQ